MSTQTPSPSKNKPALPQLGMETWFDDACVLDMDHFAKALAGIKAKGVRPDLLGSIIFNYASKWLPELSGDDSTSSASASSHSSTAAWMKKRFFIETLVGMLPEERDAVPCGFLLRLLRAASMVGAGPACMAELEARAARQLEQATLKEVMIPAFSHTSGTLLDVGLMLRLVKRFVGIEEVGRSGVAGVKVAKLVDSYLAEAALDAGLTVTAFEEVARMMPGYTRACDDGLYRAIDTYIKVHPNTTKQERKALCKLMDTRKLSTEAALHVTQNERLPVRSVIQVLFSEQAKLNRFTDWSGSFSGTRSPTLAVDASGHVTSKREVLAQHQEMRRLREDVAKLQLQCHTLQAQMSRLMVEKKKKKGIFGWTNFLFRSKDMVEKMEDYDATPMNVKKVRSVQGRATPSKRRNSMS